MPASLTWEKGHPTPIQKEWNGLQIDRDLDEKHMRNINTAIDRLSGIKMSGTCAGHHDIVDARLTTIALRLSSMWARRGTNHPNFALSATSKERAEEVAKHLYDKDTTVWIIDFEYLGDVTIRVTGKIAATASNLGERKAWWDRVIQRVYNASH